MSENQPETPLTPEEIRQRFNDIDREGPVSQEDVDALHASLPPRNEGESVQDWLKRVIPYEQEGE